MTAAINPTPALYDAPGDVPDVLGELARVRCLFQLRAVSAVMGFTSSSPVALPVASSGEETRCLGSHQGTAPEVEHPLPASGAVTTEMDGTRHAPRNGGGL